MGEPGQCPHCGKPLPPGALEGLCPACLLQQGTAPDTVTPSDRPPFEPPPLTEMARLFPQLEVLELIGKGGMGAVYKARQPALDRHVALKILPPQAAAGGTAFADRFNREARALARLNHPNIVAVYDFGQTAGFHFFVMEFVGGVNLRQLERTRRLSPREALQIIPQICDALQYAHDEGIVHRDIKPENVLVDRKGRVKIADFGLAKLLGRAAEDARLTGEGQIMGTPHYMAPEQIEHPLDVDHRADIYSLGVVFYEMLTGELPLGRFPPPSSCVQGMQLDVRLDEVVLRTLEKEPKRRYQHASEVKTRVQTIAATPSQSSDSPPLLAAELVSGASRSTSPPVASPGSRADAAHWLPLAPWTARHLRRGGWVALVVFLLVTLTAAVATFLMQESYEAVARLYVHPASFVFDQSFDPYFLQTEFQLVKSAAVLTQVIDRLDLRQRWGQRYGAPAELTTVEAMRLLKNTLSVRQTRNSTILQIGVFGERPDEAAEIANEIAERYVAFRPAAGPDTPRVRVGIVEQAVAPQRPIRPNKPLNLAVGTAGGVVLGLLTGGIAILLSALRDRASAPAMPGTPPADAPPRPPRAGAFSGPALRYGTPAVGLLLAATLGTLVLMTAAHRRDAARHEAELAAVRARAAAEKAAVTSSDTGRTPNQARPDADRSAGPTEPAEAAATVSPSLSSTSNVALIEFREAFLPDAIRMLTREMKLNCVLDPAIVAGPPDADGRPGPPPQVSVRWENITPQQALTTLLNTYNLELIEDPATGIARIAPKAAPAPATATDFRSR